MENLTTWLVAGILFFAIALKHIIPLVSDIVAKRHEYKMRELEINSDYEVDYVDSYVEKKLNELKESLDKSNNDIKSLKDSIGINDIVQGELTKSVKEINSQHDYDIIEIQNVLDRLEKLELKTFNKINNPKVDITTGRDREFTNDIIYDEDEDLEELEELEENDIEDIEEDDSGIYRWTYE